MQEQASSTPTETQVQVPEEDRPAADPATPPEAAEQALPGFRSRGRARRRARFLRKARELAYRDLGGLVFNLHRFAQRNDPLVLAKLTTLDRIDAELRALEGALHEHQAVTVLREAGITACPRCAAIHSSEDCFCPNCGLPVDRHTDLPAGFQAPAAPTPATAMPAPTYPIAQPGVPQPPGPAPATQSTGAWTRPQPPTPSTEAQTMSVPAQAAPPPDDDQDGPTEILRPPTAGT